LGLVTVLVAAGAVGLSEVKTAALGESFRLKVGESVLIEGEALQIGFEDVPTDSRCPKGERCIWEGDATVRIWARQASRAKKKYELQTSAREQSAVSCLGYGIQLLQLTPYPVSGRTIEPGDYEATLEVTRGSSPPPDTR
jgi:hypothetical protein